MSKKRIAFLTSSNMVGGDQQQRDDACEHDLEFALFAAAASARGLELVEVVWDKPGISWCDFAAVLVGTTWDYVQNRDRFFQVMAEIDSQTRLFNSLSTLISNGDKGYLLDLAAKGVPTIPTKIVSAVTEQTIAAAFAHFDTDQLVAKPKVGASAWRQALLVKNQPLPSAEQLPEGEAFLQPFLPAIQSKGEVSMLFYDGQFSHGIRKTPKAGDYRIQSIYGGVDQAIDPETAEMQLAKQALAAVDEMPLYARVDIVSGLSGEPLLIEMEMIEPYHYVEQGPNCGEMLMDALVRRL